MKTPTKIIELEPTRKMPIKSWRPLETLLEMVPNSVLELTEQNWLKSLWEEVWRANEMRDNKGKAPIAKVDLDKKQACIDLVTTYANTHPNILNASKASSMKELPSFITPERSEYPLNTTRVL